MKLVKIFRHLSLLFLLIGLLLFVKPTYFYLKSYFVEFILNKNWDYYKDNGIIKNNFLDVVPSGKIIISKIGIDNIILKGGDRNTLSYGLGLVDNGVDLHQNKYNIVIAGHRDTHFNKLKSVNKGDSIVIEHIEGKSEYIVSDIVLVEPSEITYLEKNNFNTLTLITCFPFNYVGNAPLRMIVIGKLTE